MFEMLIAQASAYPAFRFRRGVRVVGPVVDDDRVVGVDLMTDAGTERLPADYVFAGDGRFSVMRKAVGLDQPRKPELFDVVWLKLPMPAFYTGQPMTIRGYFSGGHFGLFIPSYSGSDSHPSARALVARGTRRRELPARPQCPAWREPRPGKRGPQPTLDKSSTNVFDDRNGFPSRKREIKRK